MVQHFAAASAAAVLTAGRLRFILALILHLFTLYPSVLCRNRLRLNLHRSSKLGQLRSSPHINVARLRHLTGFWFVRLERWLPRLTPSCACTYAGSSP